jgi:alpha-N-arabinofuranosidase
VRYPGGTIANTFDWKRAIGGTPGCQVDGNGSAATGFPAVRQGLSWGPDEYMEFLDLIDAQPLVMVPFVTETPADAADWVEYMNAPASAPGNPNGGVDWADVRAANGHPAPYGVRRWEIGNEQHHDNSRYWLAADDDVAVRQYAFGGHRDISREALGRNCAHPLGGVPSDGTTRQVFEALYPPVEASSVRVEVAGRAWGRVDSLTEAGPNDRVYVLDATHGRVVFGDGTHGAIPPSGSAVLASYRSVHAGYFAFAKRMKAVDPTIKVCASWGNRDFIRLVQGRRYDCLTAHAITSFGASEDADWANALEGHDRFMAAAAERRKAVAALLGELPADTPLWLTEFTTINGDRLDFPSWATSASHAAYMATLWGAWLELNVPWGMGDDLLWGFDRAVLGPTPHYTYTADAVTREALAPMFEAGGHVLSTSVTGNPLRDPAAESHPYRGLTVTATRRADGQLYLLVVNRMPFQDIKATVRLDHFRSSTKAVVREVRAESFRSWNRPEAPPAVTLRISARRIGVSGFSHTFPSTSTTVIRIPRR